MTSEDMLEYVIGKGMLDRDSFWGLFENVCDGYIGKNMLKNNNMLVTLWLYILPRFNAFWFALSLNACTSKPFFFCPIPEGNFIIVHDESMIIDWVQIWFFSFWLFSQLGFQFTPFLSILFSHIKKLLCMNLSYQNDLKSNVQETFKNDFTEVTWPAPFYWYM